MTPWRDWHRWPTLEVLPAILGKVLVHECRGRRVSGVIIEAEAYVGEDDPACHAARGRTPRNAVMYGPPGVSYVYLNYGLHHLINVVTEAEGVPAAVLIRALRPLEGRATMRRRRGVADERRLCNGPGNLTQALGITLRHNGLDLATSAVRIEDHGIPVQGISYSPRVGIRVGTDRLWRAQTSDI